jgi:hypothetical protein
MTALRLRSLSRGLGLNPRRRAASGGAPPIVQDGLVAEWRFDEGAGQVLTDYTGNGHHGRLGSTTGSDPDDPAWSAEGLVFTATQSDIVVCDTVGISGGAARTVLAAVKTDASRNFGVEWPGTGPNFQRYTLRHLSNNLRLEVAGAGHTSSLGLNASSWHFVGATQSGSNLNTAVLYRDGGSEAVPTSQVIDTRGDFQFGRFSGIFAGMTGAYILVYNRALSAAEVEQNRQVIKAILASRGITLP